MENPEFCPKCDHQTTNRVFSSRIHFIGASVKPAYFDHALGKVVKSEYDRKETMKVKELIEVGSETKESLHKHTVIAKEKQREKEWSDL